MVSALCSDGGKRKPLEGNSLIFSVSTCPAQATLSVWVHFTFSHVVLGALRAVLRAELGYWGIAAQHIQLAFTFPALRVRSSKSQL